MRKLSFLISISLFIGMFTSYANAQTRSCYKDGQWHSHGTRIGDSICRDGTWVKIKSYRETESEESVVSENFDPFKAILKKFSLPNWFVNN